MTHLSRPSNSKPGDAHDYDAGERDLFIGHRDGLRKAVKDRLRHNVNSMIDSLVNEDTAEIEQCIRQEFTAEMVGILKYLDQHENSESQQPP